MILYSGVAVAKITELHADLMAYSSDSQDTSFSLSPGLTLTSAI